MKLVIDIPENTYRQIQALARNGYFEHDICGNSMRRIANGKSLDTVLDEIRAEIEDYESDCNYHLSEEDNCRTCNKVTFGSIYRIIDKYKAGDNE